MCVDPDLELSLGSSVGVGSGDIDRRLKVVLQQARDVDIESAHGDQGKGREGSKNHLVHHRHQAALLVLELDLDILRLTSSELELCCDPMHKLVVRHVGRQAQSSDVVLVVDLLRRIRMKDSAGGQDPIVE